jgi:hypothetical protein
VSRSHLPFALALPPSPASARLDVADFDLLANSGRGRRAVEIVTVLRQKLMPGRIFLHRIRFSLASWIRPRRNSRSMLLWLGAMQPD